MSTKIKTLNLEGIQTVLFQHIAQELRKQQRLSTGHTQACLVFLSDEREEKSYQRFILVMEKH